MCFERSAFNFNDNDGGLMKDTGFKLSGCRPAGLAVAVIAVVAMIQGLSPAAWQDTVALLMEKSPAQGGNILPGQGVHSFAPGSKVTLTAVPKPGYQFVYWLGDVDDPTTARTITHLDTPKIIIAVFERSEYEFLAPSEMVKSSPVGGIVGRAADYSRRGGGGGGGKRPRKPGRQPEPPEPPEPDDFLPVPEEGDDFPVPVPEPATGLLMMFGSFAVLYRRRASRKL